MKKTVMPNMKKRCKVSNGAVDAMENLQRILYVADSCNKRVIENFTRYS
jgi:hypothetical protein